MRYSQIVGKAFSLLKVKGIWAFDAGAALIRLAIVSAVVGGTYLLLANLARFGGPANLLSANGIGAQLAYAGVVWLAAIVAWPISLVEAGGLISVQNRSFDGAEVRSGDGWRAGRHAMGRIFVLQLIGALIIFGVVCVAAVPLIAVLVGAFAASSRLSDTAGPGLVFGGICLGYLFALVVAVLGAMFVSLLLGFADCYIVIGGRRAMDALSASWKAMRARPKNFFLFALMVLGFGLLAAIVLVALEAPLQFALRGMRFSSGQSADLAMLLRNALIIDAFTFAIMLPYNIFHTALLTAFFRGLTGIDAPAPLPAYPPAPGYPPAPTYAPTPVYAPAPAYPPAPSYPPTPPTPPAHPGGPVDENASGWVASPQGNPHDASYPPPAE